MDITIQDRALTQEEKEFIDAHEALHETYSRGYRLSHRVVRAYDRVPTVGQDRYGSYIANACYWGTSDELYFIGHVKPNHPVPVPFNEFQDSLVNAQLAVDGYYNPYA